MCGIAAIFSYGSAAPLVDQAELLRIRESMFDRGPDGAGMWVSADQKIGLAHRRLSIMDISKAGSQPMFTSDFSLAIIFNGEIYNFRELRKQLEVKGYCFRSNSDTEVLLYLYQELGPDMVKHLRGMFAFAIWDERNCGIFLARDHFGIKPLYYSDNGSTIRVASQVKSLLKGQIDTTPEPAGHVGFYLWGHVPEPYTLYKGIRALPAGTSLWIDAVGHKVVRQYFNITETLAEASESRLIITSEEMRERLGNALRDTVRHHLIADVPVGVCLSSGLDSSTLVALAKELGVNDLNTVTIGFKEFQEANNDEVPTAELFAKIFDTKQFTRLVSKEDFQNSYVHLLDVMDQPSIDGVNSYFLSKAAKDAGLKVMLSGLGGDELLGGYPSFHQIPLIVKAFEKLSAIPTLGKSFRYISAPILKRFTSQKYAGLLEYGGSYGGAYLLRRGMFMPWELPDLLDGEMVKKGWEELRPLTRLEQTIQGVKNTKLKVTGLETAWYMRNQLLRDTDWASMAHSVEMRVPLVDIELFRTILPMTNSNHSPNKLYMAETPKTPLMQEIKNRTKTGFDVPLLNWLSDTGVNTRSDRGLKAWAKQIKPKSKGFRIVVLLTDAFGGYGGIAQFNRDLLKALCDMPDVAEVVAVPRGVTSGLGELPAKLRYLTKGASSKLRFILESCSAGIGSFDLIVCAHINLLPAAMVLKAKQQVPLVLNIHGIEVWQPHSSILVRSLMGNVDAIWSVSEFTRNKMIGWSELASAKFTILPNAIDLDRYRPGARNQTLVERYGLNGKRVMMVLCRLPGYERYKGIDETLELMPRLLEQIPNLTYLIAGDGEDRPRLEKKVASLGVTNQVVFTGFIQESEKINHYRLADIFVMPGRGEGFGIVYLEAMACGLPVVASKLDGSFEALRNGMLGRTVDPNDSVEIEAAILAAFDDPKCVPEGLKFYSVTEFNKRVVSATLNLLRS